MIGKYFRPWGEIKWLLRNLPECKWEFIGCLSSEDRFIGGLMALENLNMLKRAIFFKIIDPPSKDSQIILTKLNDNQSKLKLATQKTVEIEDHYLLEPYNAIVLSLEKFLESKPRDVIVDISTFPKRFFFPIIKLLVKAGLSNLVVIYSNPIKYCSDELSGNPHSWDHLPLFMPVKFPEEPIDLAIVGVGFMPFGLPDLLLSKYNATPVKFLFPFPPGPPNYQRTWDFVRKIEKSFTFKNSDNIIRLDANNVPDAFEYIVQETDGSIKKPIFAPYGPKPISLAMCIYATLFDSPVYYTQPTQYNPEYSIGIKNTYAYSLLLNEKNVYQN